MLLRFSEKIRTKTSIRYAKENDREKRERKKGRFSGRFLLKGRGKILMKSPEPGNKAQRMVEYKNYHAITMRKNYYRKLSVEIMSGNYYRKISASISITRKI